jgi:hypothetical protein
MTKSRVDVFEGVMNGIHTIVFPILLHSAACPSKITSFEMALTKASQQEAFLALVCDFPLELQNSRLAQIQLLHEVA